jgi:hypothetical protein
MAARGRERGFVTSKDLFQGLGVEDPSTEQVAGFLTNVREAERPPHDVAAEGAWSTLGLEAALGPEKPVKRPWSTAIASPHSLDLIEDARVDGYYGDPLPFRASRRGTWIAASASIGDVRVTAISIYGLLDEKSDASVHRSLSELSPIFDHETYGKRLLLGGDLNILAGRPVGDHQANQPSPPTCDGASGH